jgi:hypothetical protein
MVGKRRYGPIGVIDQDEALARPMTSQFGDGLERFDMDAAAGEVMRNSGSPSKIAIHQNDMTRASHR